MPKALKTRASKHNYVSQNQLTIAGFETPFSQKLNPNNRWVLLSSKIPWDRLVVFYQSKLKNTQTGASSINPRVVIGAMIIKHICDLSDEETVLQIQENMYMQFFIGYSGFSTDIPFDSSLFVEFRKRLSIEDINRINEELLGVEPSEFNIQEPDYENVNQEDIENNAGDLIIDATVCPQDISYPTDLNLLNDAREKTEHLIDILYKQTSLESKPRTYREIARKKYLNTAQKKRKSKKVIRKALREQLGYLDRNIKTVGKLLDLIGRIPLNQKDYRYFLIIGELLRQQQQMYQSKTKSIEHRIVSIHQPHVRPIVRGKSNAQTEFGSKILLTLMNGYSFLEELSWEAYNEGQYLMKSVERYKQRFGHYPHKVLADKIFCNKENRRKLKLLGIMLRAKPLGRPKAVEQNHVSPGERNPIEGKFGQAKTAYGMGRIRARLKDTSQSWIATIVLVLNLVKLAGEVPLWLLTKLLTFSVLIQKILRTRFNQNQFELLFQ
jgi:transposase, IS5 family